MKRATRATVALLLVQAALLGCTGYGSPRSEPDPPARVEVARARQGMVVAGHPEAAEIGVRVLAAGGNAMDAAVAVSLALGVAEPYGSGLGGKLMMLYREAASGRVFAVDAMDESSATFDVEAFAAASYEQRSEGWGAVAIPGLLSGMYEGHRRWGARPWTEVVAPAAELARAGSLVLPQTRMFFERRVDRIRVSDEAARIYLPGGELPEAGTRLANPDLAETLEIIAREGPGGFYRGPVAEAVAGASRAGGGSLTLSDLAGYRARVTEPLAVDVASARVFTAPPPANGGATLLAALARLDGAEWNGDGLLDPDHLDRIGSVLKRTYPEIQARVADVPSARADFYRLIEAPSPPLSDRGVHQGADRRPTPPTRAVRVSSVPGADARSAFGSGKEGLGQGSQAEGLSSLGWGGESTTHFVVVDSDGNAASVTQSLSHHFGAGVVAPGTGVLFNNSLKNFATRDVDSVNYAAPAKRPRSTIAPTLVAREGEPVLAIGIPGGQRIPTATLQVLLDVLVFRTDLAAAIRRPRVHLKRPLRESEPSNLFELEVDAPRLVRALEKRGWATRVSDDNEAFGGFCAIEILPDRTLLGVADLRRTNAARGF